MIPCEEVFGAILLTVDNELVDPAIEELLTTHCSQCPPCDSTLNAHRQNVELLKSLLGAACQEVISDSLHERLIAQTQALAAQMQAGFYTQIYSETFSQTTVTIDGETTIEISHTQEFREGF